MPSLTPDEFAELDALFHRAADLDEPARGAFVDELRRSSPHLAERLEAMLRADAADSRAVAAIVAEGARAALGDAADESLVGQRFGAYRVERVIGHGGMGAVFLGSRADDEFQQTVAIKTIRAGRESAEGLERFRREREILARLDHPRIARLVDGGTGPSGVPFVAMEYVDGQPLMAYVNERALGLRERLRLFLDLCDAVDFVHRRLVVHRDIKPANVLVTADGQLKLLDFGISKLTDEFDRASPETATLSRPMTPEYASPEQIEGHAVTTATDVYALGVLLYELLTGERPVGRSSTNPLELARAIVAETPAPPSEAARRAAASPPAAADERRRIARQLDGDLDRVVLMAIRKEPERRYASVAAFAADVRAWLAGRPVAAQPDTFRYRARKFVGRHPAAVAAAALFAVVVTGFSAVTVRQARALARERDAAVLAKGQADANAAFLTKVFTTADPRQTGKKDLTAFDLLESGLTQLDRDTSVDPRVRAHLYLTLGGALVNLGNYAPGFAAIRKSLAETERLYGHESNETAEVLTRLGDALRHAGDVEEAYEALAKSVAIRRRLLPGDSFELADSYNNLAIGFIILGRYREADDLQAECVAMHERLQTIRTDPVSAATSLGNLGLLRWRQGKLEEALPMAQQAYDTLKATKDQVTAAWALGNVAAIHLSMGRLDESEANQRQALASFSALVLPTHSRLLNKKRDLAYLSYVRGDYAAAEQAYTALEAEIRAARGEHSEDMARLLHQHGLLDRDLGRLEEAERKQRAALSNQLAVMVRTNFRVPPIRRSLAEVLVDRGRFAEAESELREALALLPDAVALPYIERARALMALARLQTLTHRWDDAEASLDEARAIVLATSGGGSLEMGTLLLREGLLARARGDDAAAGALRRAGTILTAHLPPRHPDRVEAERSTRGVAS
jgi:serine/threonine-protein kinase